ncbi:MAG: glycosyltransferase family 1 protein [Patescibacteria group bacterium]|jgi:glycosyltransferase involved in cell wall biosynthesis
MKIAIDGRSLLDERLTGVGTYTLNLITSLAELAPRDEFLVFVSGSFHTRNRAPIFKATNIKLVEAKIPNRLLSLLLILPLSPISLDSFLPEHVDAWLFPNHDAIVTHRPYIFTVHDLSFIHLPRFFSKKDKLVRKLQNIKAIATEARHILTPSRATADDVSSIYHLPAEQITITPLGLDHTHFVPREQPSDRTFRAAYDLNRPYILAAATIEPRKNFESVIEAYDAFRSRGGEALPLVILGKPGFGFERVKKTAQAAMFADDIRFLGFVPEKHKPALFRGASCFLFPSFYEGFGLPVLEAMASGVPVITSFTSSLPEIAGDAALYVDPFNVEDLTRALQILFDPTDGKTLRDLLTKKGIQRSKLFTWEKTAQKTLQALWQLEHKN